MTRRVIARYDHRTHERIPVDESPVVPVGPSIIRDIEPYRSMIDGSRITSRSHHRVHLRDHGCIEVGNEKMESAPPKPDREKRRALLRQQLSSMTDSQAASVMQELSNRYKG